VYAAFGCLTHHDLPVFAEEDHRWYRAAAYTQVQNLRRRLSCAVQTRNRRGGKARADINAKYKAHGLPQQCAIELDRPNP
jgi:hypothetical protein